MKTRLAIPALILAVLSGHAAADQRSNAVAGAVIGSAAGAVIGHHINGRNGALVGGAIGAATGVAVATKDRDSRADSDHGRDAYIYQNDDYGYERERVVYVQPEVRERVVYVQPQTVVVHRPAHVVYRPVRQVVRYEHHGWDRHDRGNHRGHDKHWKDDKHWKNKDRHHRGRD